jgi:hypothetical protein
MIEYVRTDYRLLNCILKLKRTGKPVVLEVKPSKIRGVVTITDVATLVPLR